MSVTIIHFLDIAAYKLVWQHVLQSRLSALCVLHKNNSGLTSWIFILVLMTLRRTSVSQVSSTVSTRLSSPFSDIFAVWEGHTRFWTLTPSLVYFDLNTALTCQRLASMNLYLIFFCRNNVERKFVVVQKLYCFVSYFSFLPNLDSCLSNANSESIVWYVTVLGSL